MKWLSGAGILTKSREKPCGRNEAQDIRLKQEKEHELMIPAAARVFQKMPRETVRKVCRVIVLLFLTDCMISALFRTPITY